MRIGIYSGTFDPIHEGHILFAQVAAEQFGLDKVLLIPEAEPRHKHDVTPVEHRQRMCELATASSSEDIQVLVLEGQNSHTINGVLGAVYEMFPEDEYFILLGSDVFSGIGEWGSREDEDGDISMLADKVGFIVGIENMAELTELEQLAADLSLVVQFVEPPLVAMSSSKVRRSIANTSTEVLGLHDDVVRYIHFEKLYGAE